MPRVHQILQSRNLSAFARIFGHYGLALVALLVPSLGDNRFLVAGLLAFVLGPIAFYSSLKVNSVKSSQIDPFIDLGSLLVVIACLPEFWHLGLLLGVVIAQAPSMSIVANGFTRYILSAGILLTGMSLIALLQGVSNWLLPIMVLAAVYPSVLLYTYFQSARNKEVQQKADALSALQLLSGGVAHDFNNILTSIMGFATVAKNSGYERATTQQAIEKIQDASERATLLTRQLMSFAGDSKEKRIELDLYQEVRATADMIAPTLKAGIKIEIESLAAQPVKVVGDPIQLHQVMLNLMVNAVEASRSPGKVRVKVERVGDTAQLEVADEGEGIDDDVRDSMFQPFVTSKSSGHGLGLAVVKNIVEDHGGTVSVVSNVGLGTRFIVRLPAAGAQTQQAPSMARATILIADDELPVRMILREVLEMEGYEVLEAENGDRFLELFQTHYEQLCGVVLDVKMPGQTGWQCLNEVRRASRNLPALVVSGYDPASFDDDKFDDAMRFLAKPFRITEVKSAMEGLIVNSKEQPDGGIARVH